MEDPRKPLLCLGTTAYAEVFIDTHGRDATFRFDGVLTNRDRDRVGGTLAGLPVHWSDDARHLARTHHIVCALGTTLRKDWIEQLLAAGFRAATLVHGAATVSGKAILEPGTVIDPGCVVAAFASIGRAVRIGRLCAIGHHLSIGDYSTVHPSVTISSGCRIGTQVTIGTGAVLVNDVEIGDGAFVAAGSLVTRRVPAGALVAGSPARVVRENYGCR